MHAYVEMAGRKMPRNGIANRPSATKSESLEQARDEYLAAWRWRRSVEAALRDLELTFTQWFVLDGVARAQAAARDAVSQSDVARATELDRMTVSQVMRTLVERSLVDRGPSASGPTYRLIVTRQGKQVLRQADEAIHAANR